MEFVRRALFAFAVCLPLCFAQACGTTAFGDGGVDARYFCELGYTACPGTVAHTLACTNLATDRSNCGACGNVCSAGQVCGAGRCLGSSCVAGSTLCAGACVDTTYDPRNCGSCGHACGSGSYCVGGTCTASCGAGLTTCGLQCVDTRFDPTNCGSCSHVCTSGQFCDRGTCNTTCGAPTVRCGGQCADTRNDPANCGGCGRACQAGELCSSGTCVAFCATGRARCGSACVDLSTDPMNCGSCGTGCTGGSACHGGACHLDCPTGRTDCGTGVCVDVATDRTNCGTCGVSCGAGGTCTAGMCTCPTGQLLCSTGCIDTTTDPMNCGGCGRRCSPGSSCVAGSCPLVPSNWNFDGNDVRHSGTNPAEHGRPPLTLDWSAAVSTTRLSPVAVENAMAFVTSSGYFGSGQLLIVYDAFTGVERWRYNFGDVFGIGHPGASGGRVYVAQCDNGGNTFLYAFDSATGTIAWRVPFDSQWENYYGPIVVDGRIYFDGGGYGGLYGFATTDGTMLFHAGLEQYDEWSPAFWGTHVYTFIAGHVRAHDPLTGTAGTVADVPWTWEGWSMHTSPVFDDTHGYVISPPNLHAIDPAALSVAWSANASFEGTPAVSEGRVYALSAGSLMARDAGTGALLWSFVGDGMLAYTPVLAAGTVYVSSDTNVYAIDTTTHAMTWTASSGGELSIAAGHLFVAGSTGTLHAYTLTP